MMAEWIRHSVFTLLVSLASLSVSADTFILGTASAEPFHNEQMTGMVDQLLTEAFQRLGHRVTILSEPAERSLVNANFGKQDGDAFRIGGISTLYPNLIQSTVPLYQNEFSAFSNKPIPAFSGLENLDAMRIGIVRGHKILEQKTTRLNVQKVNDPETLFEMLAVDRFDVVLINKEIGLIVSAHFPDASINVLEPPLISRSMYFYLNERHADLVKKLDQVLMDMKRDGSFQKITEGS